MAKLQTIDTVKQVVGELEIEDQILDTSYHPQVVKDAVVHYLAGKRQGSHSTKTRAEVSYSTRKLYRQKGTGNARAASAKSPIRRHGGVTFGPKPRDYSTKLNKKVRKLALRSLFAEKVRKGYIQILDSLELTDHKTRNFKKLLGQLVEGKVLIVMDTISENLERASRNLPDVHVMTGRNVNTYELMRFPSVIFVKGALDDFTQRLN